MTRAVKITEFNGTDLDTDYIRLVEAEDTGSTVHSRILTLRNGVKYDVDGTSRADRTPGQVYATFECIGAAKGTWHADDRVIVITALEGYRGTLKGEFVDGAGTVIPVTCTARMTQARPRPIVAGQGTPWTRHHRVLILVDCIFERLTEWTT